MLKKDFGLKKNLLRVKQLADQGLGRAEKTEVLSEDLQNAEKKVEGLKLALQSMVKRLSLSLQAYNIQDTEKRAKKMPAMVLGSSLQENSTQLGEGMLSDILHQCGSGLQSIGYAQQTYELIIEKSTLAYFQQLLDTDIPAIKKSKALLSRLTLDMDATRSRQQSANKESSHHPSSHNQNKTESLNNDLEEAEHRVTACKDQYATEMLTFISKEADICQKIIEWMDAQVSFHKSSLQHLEDMLPDLKCMRDQHSTRPIFGCPLDEHLQSIGKEIALVIEACIGILFHDGLEEEGLFRIAGSASKLKKLKAAFNVGTMIDMDEYYSDFHVVAGALKQYIRELPEPLLTFELFDEFLKCMSVKDRDSRLQQLWTVVNKLPKNNLANVKYLIKFLAKLAEKSTINKMTPSNIAIVFGPNLLWSTNEDDDTNVAMSAVQNQVVETLVQHHEYFFPGDVEFADVDSIAGNSRSSPQQMTSFGHSAPNSAERPDDSHSNSSPKIKPHLDLSVGGVSLSTSQLSITSTDSSTNGSIIHSPSTLRKNKKHAPSPPSLHSLLPHKEPPVKPERPETKPPEVPIIRFDSVQKPTIPPPMPPSKPLNRPNNPPPPTPPTVSQPRNNSTSSGSAEPGNPFLEDMEGGPVGVARSLSDGAQPEGDTRVGTHSRNASMDITTNQSSPAEVKGHSRAKSHDLRLRQPPPIPQRTHSIPAKHSSSATKRIAMHQGSVADTPPLTPDSAPPVLQNPSDNTDILVDLGPVSPSGSKERAVEVIAESTDEAMEHSPDYRDRMNSQSNATEL